MSEKINYYLDQAEKYLDDHPNFVTQTLAKAEQKTGVKRRYILLAIGLLMVVYLIVGYAAPLLCNFIGFVYPAYASVKAIESRATGDDTAWLMYWVVYSSFSCLEFFSDIILSWLPFYYFLKCMFLGWCMGIFPFAGNGSTLIYGKFIRPFVLRNEGKIDEALGLISDKAGKLAGEVQEQQQSAISESITSNLTSLIGGGEKKSE